jgi:GT2 family glycosyltransferase
MERYPEAALGTMCFKEDIPSSIVTSASIIEEHFFKNELLNIGPSGTIFRKDAFEKIGYFDIRFGIASDNYVNIKLAAMYPVVLLPKVFFFYRKHEGQQQHNSLFGYLQNNYFLQPALLNENIIPITQVQKKILKNRIKKNLRLNLVKIIINPTHWRKAIGLAFITRFGFKENIK